MLSLILSLDFAICCFDERIIYSVILSHSRVSPLAAEGVSLQTDLLALESFRLKVSLMGGQVQGFLPPEEWEPYLSSMPNRALHVPGLPGRF